MLEVPNGLTAEIPEKTNITSGKIPATAEFQLPRVAKERGASLEQLRALVSKHSEGRQWGFLGEPRVNVLELNLELDRKFPLRREK